MTAHQADNEDVDMDAVLEDHTQCEQRITHLEGLLASKDAAIKTEQDKIQAYTGTIKLLRDELHKQGAIRGSISDRLQQLGLSVVSTAAGASSSTTVDVRSSFDIGGTLLDFNGPCDAHKRLPLSAVMPITTVPPCADVWFAKDPYELAQGLEIAESLQIPSATRALFFGNNSPLASFSAYAKPSEASLVRVMSKLADVCPARRQAFAEAAFKQLTCSSLGGSDQSALKVLVAERVRASLDGKKSLCNDPVVVLGGQNAQVLSEVIGGTYVELPTVPDLRLYLESTHFQASVGYVYVWLDIFHESFQLAEQSQLVPALRDAVVSAAKWSHVHFVVLPVPYTASLLPVFEHFMQEFNKTELKQPNVLWLNDSERFDGARFAFSLGCNQLITDFTVVTKMGHVRRRAARAALRFIRGLKPHFVPGHVDLTDPPKEEPSTSSVAHHDVASSSELHGVRRGSVHKPTRGNYGNYSARGGPSKPGGGGGRGKWNKEQRGQGRR